MYKAPAKRSQHVNATYRNIVGRNMLCAFGHRVAMCCDNLSVVGSNLTILKLELAKRTQHVAPNNVAICCVDMLRSFGRDLTISILLVELSKLLVYIFYHFLRVKFHYFNETHMMLVAFWRW